MDTNYRSARVLRSLDGANKLSGLSRKAGAPACGNQDAGSTESHESVSTEGSINGNSLNPVFALQHAGGQGVVDASDLRPTGSSGMHRKRLRSPDSNWACSPIVIGFGVVAVCFAAFAGVALAAFV